MLAYAALIDDQQDLMRFSKLVDRHQEEMLRVARSVLHETHLSEDAVQDALLGAARSIKKVPEDPKEARLYLLSSAMYAALRIKEAEDRQTALRFSGEKNTIREEDPTFAAVEQSEDYARLFSAILSLAEIYQDVLLHFYVYGQSVREVAALFGRKPSTVRQQLTRARRLLAAQYGKEGPDHD